MWKIFRPVTIILAMAATIYVVMQAEEPLDAYQKRPMPPLELKAMDGGELSTAKWALETNGPKIINLFASWCTPCIAELPELEKLNDHLPVFGIAWRDSPEDLEKWLAEHGNPYQEIGIDKGLTFIWDLGITGVPTTLLLDKSQKIVYIHEGAITQADIERVFLPKIRHLKEQKSE